MGFCFSKEQYPTNVDNMDTVEEVVCRADELKDKVMKEVDFCGQKLLLIKDGDNLNALSSKCTHYGAPLVKGNSALKTG